MNKKHVILVFVFLFLDQVTKQLTFHFIPNNETVTVIYDMLYLTSVQNYGMGWGFFEHQHFFIVVVNCICIFILVLAYFFKIEKFRLQKPILFLFVGFVGNLIDRICYSYVQDFIGIQLLGLHFPIFNLADIAIAIGIVLVFKQWLQEL